MIPVPDNAFQAAGERRPHGFNFRYNPNDPDYGIGITTDGVIPQVHSMEEAVRVGKVLQLSIFGRPAVEKTLTYV